MGIGDKKSLTAEPTEMRKIRVNERKDASPSTECRFRLLSLSQKKIFLMKKGLRLIYWVHFTLSGLWAPMLMTRQD